MGRRPEGPIIEMKEATAILQSVCPSPQRGVASPWRSEPRRCSSVNTAKDQTSSCTRRRTDSLTNSSSMLTCLGSHRCNVMLIVSHRLAPTHASFPGFAHSRLSISLQRVKLSALRILMDQPES